jgi:hypothetical protein
MAHTQTFDLLLLLVTPVTKADTVDIETTAICINFIGQLQVYLGIISYLYLMYRPGVRYYLFHSVIVGKGK